MVVIPSMGGLVGRGRGGAAVGVTGGVDVIGRGAVTKPGVAGWPSLAGFALQLDITIIAVR
jgi:hypothetical protein